MGVIDKQVIIDTAEDMLLSLTVTITTTRDLRKVAQEIKDGTRIRYFLKALNQSETEQEDVIRILFALNELANVYGQQTINELTI
jgi:hypothetical protein